MQSNITKLHKSLSNRDKTIRLLQEEVKDLNQIVEQRNDEVGLSRIFLEMFVCFRSLALQLKTSVPFNSLCDYSQAMLCIVIFSSN